MTALCAQIRHLPAVLCWSLTWDRGMELVQHKQLTLATKVDVYFVIRKVRGSAAPTKTRTACSVSISRKAPPCHSTPR
ncbi:hypothetical protein COMA2_160015 [Candidatus Nitrospira nitrificans]|uniref:Transposase n=1 Tax=Candidatus Nitrospira nitrificans TaxID=1742973 RepID=A0A0S4LC40_9BACT|nr:hypothetical protein COMA2_160015 [Candidatus Nitrospira nitrificans]